MDGLPHPDLRRVRLEADGSLVLPIELRRALGIEEGGEVLLAIEEGRLLITTRSLALKRLQRKLRDVVPSDESLMEELLADRRREAAALANGD